MYICTYMHTHIHIYTCMHTCAYMRQFYCMILISLRIHTRVHTYIHTYTHRLIMTSSCSSPQNTTCKSRAILTSKDGKIYTCISNLCMYLYVHVCMCYTCLYVCMHVFGNLLLVKMKEKKLLKIQSLPKVLRVQAIIRVFIKGHVDKQGR